MAEEVAGQRCTDAHSPAVQDLLVLQALALQGLPDLQAPASGLQAPAPGLASPACFESAPAYLRFNSHFSLHLSCSLTSLYTTMNLNHSSLSNPPGAQQQQPHVLPHHIPLHAEPFICVSLHFWLPVLFIQSTNLQSGVQIWGALTLTSELESTTKCQKHSIPSPPALKGAKKLLLCRRSTTT